MFVEVPLPFIRARYLRNSEVGAHRAWFLLDIDKTVLKWDVQKTPKLMEDHLLINLQKTPVETSVSRMELIVISIVSAF